LGSDATQVTAQVAGLLSIALKVLGARALVLVPMVLSFVLFAWDMVFPTVLGTVAASLFALLVFLPVLIRNLPNGPAQA
jgi:hypothetical protein